MGWGAVPRSSGQSAASACPPTQGTLWEGGGGVVVMRPQTVLAAWPAPRGVRSYTFCPSTLPSVPQHPSVSIRIGRALPGARDAAGPPADHGARRGLAPEAGLSGSVRRSLCFIGHTCRAEERPQSPQTLPTAPTSPPPSPSGKFRGKRLIRSEESGTKPGRRGAASRFTYEGRLRNRI